MGRIWEKAKIKANSCHRTLQVEYSEEAEAVAVEVVVVVVVVVVVLVVVGLQVVVPAPANVIHGGTT